MDIEAVEEEEKMDDEEEEEEEEANDEGSEDPAKCIKAFKKLVIKILEENEMD